MIKNIIFDFGDIFINLDKTAVPKQMADLGLETMTPDLEYLAEEYEKGNITSSAFLEALQTESPEATETELKSAWNTILLDFPEYRLKFLERLSEENNYRLFLLSNTNDLHIKKVVEIMGELRFARFKDCFEGFYLSHDIHLRKPDPEIFSYVLDINGLKAAETLFVDDSKTNTESARQIGIQCWHLRVGQEDVVDLEQKLR